MKRLAAILYTERWGWTSFGGLGTDVWEVSNVQQRAVTEPDLLHRGTGELTLGQVATGESDAGQASPGEVGSRHVACSEGDRREGSEPPPRQVQPGLLDRHVGDHSVGPAKPGHSRPCQPYAGQGRLAGVQVRQGTPLYRAIDEGGSVHVQAAEVGAREPTWREVEQFRTAAAHVCVGEGQATVAGLRPHVVIGQNRRLTVAPNTGLRGVRGDTFPRRTPRMSMKHTVALAETHPSRSSWMRLAYHPP